MVQVAFKGERGGSGGGGDTFVLEPPPPQLASQSTQNNTFAATIALLQHMTHLAMEDAHR